MQNYAYCIYMRIYLCVHLYICIYILHIHIHLYIYAYISGKFNKYWKKKYQIQISSNFKLVKLVMTSV